MGPPAVIRRNSASCRWGPRWRKPSRTPSSSITRCWAWGPGRGSQPAFNVQALGHPQSAEEKSADGDQQQTCQEGISCPRG